MRILVAYTGGSELDRRVLELAKQHAKVFNATLFVATSREQVADESDAKEVERLEGHFEYLRNALAQEGLVCETHLLVRGLTPGEDIVEFANDHKIDEIFIGIEKTSKVGKLLFGSNAQFIILEAPCPVVSIK